MSNFCQLVQQTSQKKKGVGPFLNPGEFQHQTVPVIPAPKRLIDKAFRLGLRIDTGSL